MSVIKMAWRKHKVWAIPIGLFIGWIISDFIPGMASFKSLFFGEATSVAAPEAAPVTKYGDVKVKVISEAPVAKGKEADVPLMIPAYVIGLGVTRDHIASIIGTPTSKERCDSNGSLVVEVYGFSDRYLRFVYDDIGVLRFYSLTLRHGSSIVMVPLVGKRLGEFDFNTAASVLGHPDVVEHYAGSKYFSYGESYEQGNPGNYRTIYMAFDPSGVDLTPGLTEVTFPGSDDAVRTARRNFPNSFGVAGGLFGSYIDYGRACGLGVDYFRARELSDSSLNVRFNPETFW